MIILTDRRRYTVSIPVLIMREELLLINALSNYYIMQYASCVDHHHIYKVLYSAVQYSADNRDCLSRLVLSASGLRLMKIL